MNEWMRKGMRERQVFAPISHGNLHLPDGGHSHLKASFTKIPEIFLPAFQDGCLVWNLIPCHQNHAGFHFPINGYGFFLFIALGMNGYDIKAVCKFWLKKDNESISIYSYHLSISLSLYLSNLLSTNLCLNKELRSQVKHQ